MPMTDGVSWTTCCFSFHSRLATAARIRGLGPKGARGKRQGIAWGRGHFIVDRRHLSIVRARCGSTICICCASFLRLDLLYVRNNHGGFLIAEWLHEQRQG
jgi:hypothetical protein